MPSAARSIAILILIAGISDAAAQERCSGTLCDLYYGDKPASDPQPAKPAAPTPLMVPKGGILGLFSGGDAQPAAPGTAPAPATRRMIGVGGGGLAAMARGETPERCSGSLCDLYYGGPPPEPQAQQPGSGAPTAEAPATAEAAAEAEVEPTPPGRRTGQAGVRYYEGPQCAATARDPWQCYR